MKFRLAHLAVGILVLVVAATVWIEIVLTARHRAEAAVRAAAEAAVEPVLKQLDLPDELLNADPRMWALLCEARHFARCSTDAADPIHHRPFDSADKIHDDGDDRMGPRCEVLRCGATVV